MKQTLIRQASESDIDSICRLQQRWFEENSVYGFVPENREQVEAALNAWFLVAEANEEIVGFISGSIRNGFRLAIMKAGGAYLEIENLYVAPEFRKRGIGGDLITELLARAKQQNVAYAFLYSASKDIQGVLKFYEKRNFQTWSVQMFRKL